MLEGISGGIIVAIIDFLMVFLVLGGLAVVIVGLSKFVEFLDKPAEDTEPKSVPASPQSPQPDQIQAHVAAITTAMSECMPGSLEAFHIEGVRRGGALTTYRVVADDEAYDVTVTEGAGGAPGIAPPQAASAPAPSPTSGGSEIQAPMPGKILAIHVKQGNTVKSGAVLIILEAMKMENDIVAPINGTVASVNVNVGDTVNTGDVLVVLNES